MRAYQEYLENLVNSRFNFFVVFFGLVVAAAASSDSARDRLLLFSVGILVCCPTALTIARAQMKMNLAFQELTKTLAEPAAIIDRMARRQTFPWSVSMRNWVGYGIPLICCLILLAGLLYALYEYRHLAPTREDRVEVQLVGVSLALPWRAAHDSIRDRVVRSAIGFLAAVGVLVGLRTLVSPILGKLRKRACVQQEYEREQAIGISAAIGAIESILFCFAAMAGKEVFGFGVTGYLIFKGVGSYGRWASSRETSDLTQKPANMETRHYAEALARSRFLIFYIGTGMSIAVGGIAGATYHGLTGFFEAIGF